MKTSSMMLLGGFVCALAGGVAAEELFVGYNQEATVTDGAQTDAVRTRPGASIKKEGSGAWALNANALRQNNPAEIFVNEGRVEITAGAQAAAVTREDALSTLNKSAFWVDAQIFSDAGENSAVTEWRDVRDAAGGAHSHPYAVAYWADGTNAPAALAGVEGATNIVYKGGAVDFGGANSCQCMKWKAADGTDLTMTNIRHVVIAANVSHGGTSIGWMIGCGEGTKCQLVPRDGGHWDLFDDVWTDWSGAWGDAKIKARVFRNGSEIRNRYAHRLGGKQVFEISVDSASAMATNGFAAAYFGYGAYGSTSASGGVKLMEALFFTQNLTDAECKQVEQYLMAKWGAEQDGAKSVIVNAGGIAAIDVPEGESKKFYQFVGDGLVEKTGAGKLTLKAPERELFNGEVAVLEGTLLTRSPMMLRPQGGKNIAVATKVTTTGAQNVDEGTQYVVSDGVAGTVEQTGAGEVAICGADRTVKKYKVANGGTLRITQKREEAAKSPSTTCPVEAYIPNASFEYNGAADNVSTVALMSKENVQAAKYGWVYKKGNNVFFYNHRKAGANPIWTKANSPHGNWSLCLKMKCNVQTTVHVPEPGVYRLTFKSTCRSGYEGKRYDVWFNGVNLGRAKAESANAYGSHDFSVSVAAAGSYVLEFKYNSSDTVDGCFILDDVRMVKVAELGELVVNGGFELPLGYGWNTSGVKLVAGEVSGVQAANSQLWGEEDYESTTMARLFNVQSPVSQTVKFPEAGKYELTFRLRSRGRNDWEWNGSGRNPVSVSLGGKSIYWTKVDNVNFVTHSVVFDVAASGDQLLSFNGLYNGGNKNAKDPSGNIISGIGNVSSGDKSALLDGVSIRRYVQKSAPPDIPQEMRIELAEGAKLKLDFAGTLKLGGLKLAGTSVPSGTYSATDYPDFLSGAGSVDVKSYGTAIFLR